jgi:peptide/nickel transport system substrate-binding protein
MNESDGDRSEKREKVWIFEREYSRRDVLKRAGAFGAAAGLSGILAACGGGGGEAAPPPAEPAPPPAEPAPPPAEPAPPPAEPAPPASEVKTGGRLRVGHVGGGEAESFNPAVGSSFIDASRYENLYDPLVRVNPDLSLAPGLALEWTANADSTVWTFALRPDVVWHDGAPFTADDVIYTLQGWGDEKHIAHSAVTNIRLAELRKVDDLTLEIPLKSPNARLVDSFTQQNNVIIKNGTTDFAKPIGTGPFKFQEFTVGERSLCVRNENYWEEGKPYVDEWEDISISDNAARLNALLAGEIDMMSQIEPTQAKAQLDGGQIQVIRAPSPTAIQVFYMAVDIPPFDDPLVRQAFRLIPDRQALIDRALLGFATVANDIPGRGLWNFAEDLPSRDQDIEQAKALLAQAGKENLEVTLHTSEIVPGFVEAATLFAEMAKDAGVTVNVKKEDPNAYFDTSKIYTKLDFGQSYWTYASIAIWYEQALFSDAIWNETHYRDTSFDDLIRQAEGASDETQALELWHQVQQKQYDEGGYIVWANLEILDAAANNVKGIVPSAWFNLGGWNYRDVWLDI